MLRSSNSCTVLQFQTDPLDGSHNVEVALSENEFDTPGVYNMMLFCF